LLFFFLFPTPFCVYLQLGRISTFFMISHIFPSLVAAQTFIVFAILPALVALSLPFIALWLPRSFQFSPNRSLPPSPFPSLPEVFSWSRVYRLFILFATHSSALSFSPTSQLFFSPAKLVPIAPGFSSRPPPTPPFPHSMGQDFSRTSHSAGLFSFFPGVSSSESWLLPQPRPFSVLFTGRTFQPTGFQPDLRPSSLALLLTPLDYLILPPPTLGPCRRPLWSDLLETPNMAPFRPPLY